MSIESAKIYIAKCSLRRNKEKEIRARKHEARRQRISSSFGGIIFLLAMISIGHFETIDLFMGGAVSGALIGINIFISYQLKESLEEIEKRY